MGNWLCEAYGDGVPDLVLCFFAAQPGDRVCTSAHDCTENMAEQRRQTYRRIQEMAAQGHPAMTYLAEQFTHPEQMLGGTHTPDEPTSPS